MTTTEIWKLSAIILIAVASSIMLIALWIEDRK